MKKLGALLLSLTLVLALFPMTASAVDLKTGWYLDSTTGDYVQVDADTDSFYHASDLASYLMGFDEDTTTLLFAGTDFTGGLTLDLNDLAGAVDLSGITVVLNNGVDLAISNTTLAVTSLDLAGIYTLGDAEVTIDFSAGGAQFDFVLNGIPFGPNGFADAGASSTSFVYTTAGLATAAPITTDAEVATAMALLPATVSAHALTLGDDAILAGAFTLPVGSSLELDIDGNDLTTKAALTVNGVLNVIDTTTGGLLTISDKSLTINGTMNVDALQMDIEFSSSVGAAGTLNLLAGSNTLATAPLTITGTVNVAGTAALAVAADSVVTGTVRVANGGALLIDVGVTLEVSSGGLLDFLNGAVLDVNGPVAGSTLGSGTLYVASNGTVHFTSLFNADAILTTYAGNLGILTLGKNAIVKPESVSDTAIIEIFGANNKNFERLSVDPDLPIDPKLPTGPKGSNLSTPLNKAGKFAITAAKIDANGNLVITVFGSIHMFKGITVNGTALVRDGDFGVSGNTITIGAGSIPAGALKVILSFVDGSELAVAR